MAGVTDRPFRALCRRLGASFAATEMVSADQRLWDTPPKAGIAWITPARAPGHRADRGPIRR
jgi:tRNA-dihydrouridine synthase